VQGALQSHRDGFPSLVVDERIAPLLRTWLSDTTGQRYLFENPFTGEPIHEATVAYHLATLRKQQRRAQRWQRLVDP